MERGQPLFQSRTPFFIPAQRLFVEVSLVSVPPSLLPDQAVVTISCSRSAFILFVAFKSLPMSTQTLFRGSSREAGALTHASSGVASDHLEQVMGRIQQELRVLRMERAAIAQRIGLIKTTIVGLTEMFGAGVAGESARSAFTTEPAKRCRKHGLTDACRHSLLETSVPQTLKQIHGRIQERCPALLAHHKYPMAIVQMMLRRLVMYGEADEIDHGRGLRAWKSTSVEPR